jgi:hypothetical protein
VNADLVGPAAGDGHLNEIGLGGSLQQGEGAVGSQIAAPGSIGGAPDQT